MEQIMKQIIKQIMKQIIKHCKKRETAFQIPVFWLVHFETLV